MNKDIKILMLVGLGESSLIMYNGLKNNFDVVRIIREEKVPRKIFIQRRIKNLGYVKVLGQILFMMFNKYLTKKSRKRINTLKEEYGLNLNPFPESIVEDVNSVNDSSVINMISDCNPDVIVVNGTRIINESVLSSTSAVFLNTHMGITPKYRGVHGGYWALVEGDYNNCGVTIHIVDKGIDTGGILYQNSIKINNEDNFNTYAYHQIAKAIPLIKKAVEGIYNNNFKIKERKDLKSVVWTHPTLFQYMYFRIFKKIK